MRLLTKLSVALPVFLSFFSSSQAHQLSGKRHFGRRHEQDLSIRAPGDMGVYKRFDGVRFTFYAPGLGACGAVSSSQDFIVALSVLSWDDSCCFKPITITVGGVSQGATIVDKCMGCPPNGLDFSPALFGAFGPLGDGVLTGSWEYGSGSPPPPPPSPSPSPPPPPPPPPPTTTSQPLPSTSAPPPSSSSSPATTSAYTTSSYTTTTATTTSTGTNNGTVSSTSAWSTTTSSGELAVETAVPAGEGEVPSGSVLHELDMAIMAIGDFLAACHD